MMEAISMLSGSSPSSKDTFLFDSTKNGPKGAPARPVVAILGSGDFARSLALRLLRCGYRVAVGSRQPRRAADSFPHVVDVTHHEDAIAKADVVFLAVRREHYASLWGLRHLLAAKVLVDVSNNSRPNQYPESNAEYLASLFPDSLVVKGFNVISSWAMQSGPREASRKVYICGDSVEARGQVLDLARRLNFEPVDMGALCSARDIEDTPLRLFGAWRGPVLAAVGLSVLFFAYSFTRDVLHPYVHSRRSDFYKIPVEVVNRTLPGAALTLLALAYLAGLLAAAHQLYHGTKYRRFPAWLEGWMQSRKQLGLLGFFLACVHVLYSLCLPLRRSERYQLLNTAFQQVLPCPGGVTLNAKVLNDIAAQYTALDRISARYTALDRISARYTALDRIAARYTASDRIAARYTALDRIAVRYTASDRIAAGYSVLNHIAEQCMVLNHTATKYKAFNHITVWYMALTLSHISTRRDTSVI
uniref:STEAP2 metalloreductase n=1 Tax=Paramormyrops kingsleyae TaxID=1676925 RepID=A0A3B3SIQ0_9TELE